MDDRRARGGRPSALVVVLHGVGARGVDIRFTGFESRGAVVAYPDGAAWDFMTRRFSALA